MDLVIDGAEDYERIIRLGLLFCVLFEANILPKGVPVMCADGVYLSRAPSLGAQYNRSYQSGSLMWTS